MFNNNSPSLADIAAVTGNNNGMWGDGGIWSIIIILALLGWGGNGFGFGGNYGGGYIMGTPLATQSDVQRGFDNQTLITKIDGQTYGIADLGYALNTQLQQAELSRANQQAALMAQLTANAMADANNARDISEQLASCCCDNKVTALNAQYQAATEACATRQAIADAKADIVEAIKQQSVDQMRAKIAEQGQIINNQFLLSQINKTPVPAYAVPNPYTGLYYTGTTVA